MATLNLQGVLDRLARLEVDAKSDVGRRVSTVLGQGLTAAQKAAARANIGAAARDEVVLSRGRQTVFGDVTFERPVGVPAGSIPQDRVTDLTTDLASKLDAADIAGKADDNAVVKLTGNQTVAGVKTFSAAPVVPDGSFTQAKVANLTTALAGKLTEPTTNAVDGKVLGRVAGAPAWVDPPAAGTASAAPSMAAERIAARLQGGSGDITVAVASDSTGNDNSDWVRLWVEVEKLRRSTDLRIEYAAWSTGTNSYTETVVQEGANQTPPPAPVMSDNFNRVGEIVGSTSSGGQVWAGNTGGFTGDGTVVKSSAARNMGFNCGTVDGSVEWDMVVTTGPPPATTQSYRFYVGAASTNFTSGVYTSLSVNPSGGCVIGVYKTISGVTTTLLAPVGTGLTSNSATPQTLKVKFTQTSQNLSLEVTPNGGATTTYTPTPVTEADYATLGTWRGASAASGAVTKMDIDNAQFTIPPAAATYRKLRVLNAAVAGASLDYQQARIATMYPSSETIDALIISSGHNYGAQTSAQYIAAVDSFVTDYTAAHPETAILYSTQNPQYSPAPYVTQHRSRQVAGRLHAKEKGWSYLPVLERFDQVNDRALVSEDGIHPTWPATVTLIGSYGATLWANVMGDLIRAHESTSGSAAIVPDVTYQGDSI